MWKRPFTRAALPCAALAATLSAALPETAAAAAPKPPVLLIHGMRDDARKMEPLARYLRAHGREVHTTTLRPSLGQVGLDELAHQLDTYVRETFPPGERFDLVGYSMGGLVSRYYVQRLGGLERVHRFVTVSSPHQGSVLAWLVPNPGGRQMRPGSAFLRDLERDAGRLQRVGLTCLWTPMDLIVVPARNSVVPGADCRQVRCLIHPWMVRQPLGQEAVRLALE